MGAFVGSVLIVVLYRFVPVPITPLMVIRVLEGAIDGKSVGIDKDWVAYEDISPNFFRAVVSAEDARFMRHGGIDWKAVDAAKRIKAKSYAEPAQLLCKPLKMPFYGMGEIMFVKA